MLNPRTGETSGSWRGEVVGGVTTFATMAYIVIVNPSILSAEGTGMPFAGVMTATVLTCFLFTLLMGLYARLPFAVAPGMGLNAFFTYTIVLGQQVAWPTALGMVFWSGVLFLLVSVTPLREALARAIPLSLRLAAAAGIGLLLTLIGLRNAGIVVDDPVTLLRAGEWGGETLLAVLGLIVTSVLIYRGSAVAFLAGIGLVSIAAALAGWVQIPDRVVSPPDFGLILRADPGAALQMGLLPAMLALLATDLFDSLSTFIGVAQANGLTDEKGNPLRLRQGLLVDALATFGAGLLGSSPGTAYVESSAGIRSGGRTGLASVVTAFCFLPCLFLAPLAGAVPAYATAPVLILVGLHMFQGVKALRLERIEEALPPFLTLILIPLTFSITQGILWGFVAHVTLYLLTGRGRELSGAMLGLGAASILLLWLT